MAFLAIHGPVPANSICRSSEDRGSIGNIVGKVRLLAMQPGMTQRTLDKKIVLGNSKIGQQETRAKRNTENKPYGVRGRFQ